MSSRPYLSTGAEFIDGRCHDLPEFGQRGAETGMCPIWTETQVEGVIEIVERSDVDASKGDHEIGIVREQKPNKTINQKASNCGKAHFLGPAGSERETGVAQDGNLAEQHSAIHKKHLIDAASGLARQGSDERFKGLGVFVVHGFI